MAAVGSFSAIKQRCGSMLFAIGCGAALQGSGWAQSDAQFFSPPSTDFVTPTSGVSANPKQPPMAIGPAPYPAPIYGSPLPYGTPLSPPYGALPVRSPVYQVNPYQTRRPTAFEGEPSPERFARPGNKSRTPDATSLLRPSADKSRAVAPMPIGPAPMGQVTYGSAPLSMPPQAPSPIGVGSFEIDNSPAIGNLRVTVSESFLNRLVARDEQKPGEVDDFIAGAKVNGVQTTETHVRLDLFPSPDKMLGAIVLEGMTNSQTTGVTSLAMVDTAGRQRFLAVKDVMFDGLNFSTRHAVVRVQARNQTLGAVTPYSGTLIGAIADRIALGVAEKRRPAAEAVARDRVVERVYPEFDKEVDQSLALANGQMENTVRRTLRQMNMMPQRQAVSSTDVSFHYSAQFFNEEPGTSTAPLESKYGRTAGVQLLVHESLLNGLVAASAGLKGLKTSDKEIDALSAPYAVPPTEEERALKPAPLKLPGMDSVVTQIILDEKDPVTFRVEKDGLDVIMRAVFKPAGQDLVPPLVVSIRYKFEISGDKMVVTPGDVRVDYQDKADIDPESVTSKMTMKVITQAVEASLTKLAFDITLPSNLWKYGGPVPRINAIRSQDGWIALYLN